MLKIISLLSQENQNQSCINKIMSEVDNDFFSSDYDNEKIKKMIDINIYDVYKKIKNIYKIKEKIYLCVALNANEKKNLEILKHRLIIDKSIIDYMFNKCTQTIERFSNIIIEFLCDEENLNNIESVDLLLNIYQIINEEVKEPILSYQMCEDIQLLKKISLFGNNSEIVIQKMKNNIAVFFQNEILNEELYKRFKESENIEIICKMIKNNMYDSMDILNTFFVDRGYNHYGKLCVQSLNDEFCEIMKEFGKKNIGLAENELMNYVDLCIYHKKKINEMKFNNYISIYEIDVIINEITSVIIDKLKKNMLEYTQKCIFSIQRHCIKTYNNILYIEGVDDIFFVIQSNIKKYYKNAIPNFINNVNQITVEIIKIYINLVYQYFNYDNFITNYSSNQQKIIQKTSNTDNWFFYNLALLNDMMKIIKNTKNINQKLKNVFDTEFSNSKSNIEYPSITLYLSLQSETNMNNSFDYEVENIIYKIITNLAYYIDFIIIEPLCKKYITVLDSDDENNKNFVELCEYINCFLHFIFTTTDKQWNYILLEMIYNKLCEGYIFKILHFLKKKSPNIISNKINIDIQKLLEIRDAFGSSINTIENITNRYIMKYNKINSLHEPISIIYIIDELLKSDNIDSLKKIIENKILVFFGDIPLELFETIYCNSNIKRTNLSDMRNLWKKMFESQKRNKDIPTEGKWKDDISFLRNIIEKTNIRNNKFEDERKKFFPGNFETLLFVINDKSKCDFPLNSIQEIQNIKN
jgi:hypothetical protein